MCTMYCNVTRVQGFPLAVRFSLRQRTVKSSEVSQVAFLPLGFCGFPVGPRVESTEMRCAAKPRNVMMSGIRMRKFVNFSSFAGSRRDAKAGKTLPWLASNRAEEAKSSKKCTSSSVRSSWEESAKKMDKSAGDSVWVESAKRMDKSAGDSIWVESQDKPERSRISKSRPYSRDERDKRDRFDGNGGVRPKKSWHSSRVADNEIDKDEEEQVEVEESEVVDDPRWDNIQNRFNRFENARDHRRERPEYRNWNKQEDWGRKTWKEATESTVPKMVGECVYGVGPVLAALSAGRREFYMLYIQEGLDLSGNNRKKKDKKGFEKILRLAEKTGLYVKEISKHDLNMVADNRPHQGLVLDASPLEMVKVKELDSVTSEEEKSCLWVALDEVTDPQNLGAIIRSAYFFGASGIVMCAKNSAPLSGVVSKASAGSLELMELRYCKNMMQFLVSSAENGWRVLGGSVSSRAVPLNDVMPGTPTILVLGSEGTGLRPLVERSCTELVRINGNVDTAADVATGDSDEVENEEFRSFLAVESLNVSVAAGVLLHHLIGNKQESISG